jgi:myo-inositol 2-dehydrogenase / D-chiro-inositol 1-dehydrogenase
MQKSTPLRRRTFLTRSAAALAATSVTGFPLIGRGKGGNELIKLALVGCGGRGAGAANQALNADSNTKLVAVADLFADKLAVGLQALQTQHPGRVDVPADRQFTGFDAYKHAIAAADVVVLGTPCAFRPAHFEEAVRLGKHAFLEKPVAVDAPGACSPRARRRSGRD